MYNHFDSLVCLPFTMFSLVLHVAHGPRREKNCFLGFANTTQAQTSLRSLISAFVIRFSEIFICKLATGEISIF